jgi:hypothetical protein
MKISAVIAAWLLLALAALAQPVPRLGYVYPAGGRAGTTFQVTGGGQNLMTVSNAFVTGPGVTAVVLEHSRPMNQNDFNELRDRLKVLQDKFAASRKANPGTNVWTVADATERDQLRAKILRNPPNRTATPALLDTVTLRITVASNTVPGEREIRLATTNALSNPFRFWVGNLPEISRPAAHPANPDLDKYLEKIGGQPAPTGTPKYEARVNLSAVINGQIMPGGVDYYRFAAQRGQQLILSVQARSLIPYLADAVPGWFEAVITVYDGKGHELACEERFRFQPDPVLHFEVPHDGEYLVSIHDSIFRGREDFVYRLTLGELPFVTGLFPLGGPAGSNTTVALNGWNLPQKTWTHENQETGVTTLEGSFFNARPFAVDDLPEITDEGAHHTPENALPVTLPVIINGAITEPGNPAVYAFTGKAGQSVVAEVFARRLNSPLDSFLWLTDAAGQRLAFNDDFEDKGTGLETHHADSYLTATLPADGTYYLAISDAQGQGGPDYGYRLRISAPRPDFTLRVVPSSVNVRAGMSTPVTVFALRRDGFTNAIDLKLSGAPAGFSLAGARIGTNQDKIQFTLKAPPQATAKPIALTLTGQAIIDGKTVVHPATPAEDLMQAFIYRHLVPMQELAVFVSPAPRPVARDTFKILTATPVKIPLGGTVKVRVSTPSAAFSERFQLTLNNAPDGLSLTNVTPVADGVELVFACDAQKSKVGQSGNLICALQPKKAVDAPAKKKPVAPNPTPTTFPAIPFNVVAH